MLIYIKSFWAFIIFYKFKEIVTDKTVRENEVYNLQRQFHRVLGEAILKASADTKRRDLPHHAIHHKVLNGDSSNILVMSVAIGLNDFLMKENAFLHDIETHMNNAYVRCQIDDSTSSSHGTSLIDLYCYYLPKQSNGPVTFVPLHKLERLFISGSMRGFLQKYNITKFLKKSSTVVGTPLMSSLSLPQHFWFPIGLGVVSFLLLVAVIILIYMCCHRNRNAIEGDIEKPTTVAPFQQKTKKPSFVSSSPIKGRKNSFTASPRKGFTYSPQKNSTPIFSFTSPKKYSDKVIYPAHSPMETASPFQVQPKLNLLYPSVNSPNNSRKWSGNTTMNSSEKSKSLYQSRMGSSASLIIDLSPKTPVPTYSVAAHESPTEEILLCKSRCLSFCELQKAKNNDKELHEEFWSIPPNTVARKDSQMRFSLKNRYPDILPNSRSMVRLKKDQQSTVYMNANLITGHKGVPNQFIATQGPLACTIADFWAMMWQFNCSVIVMITKLKEKNKEKCVQYWPSPDSMSQQVYGDIVVTCDSEMERDGYRITTLYTSQKGSDESRKVTHFLFTSWPDHKVPKEYRQVISLMNDVRQLQATCDSPIVIHCSAGRGRTGCFIGLALGMDQIDEDNEVDILRIVSRIRIERGGLVDKDNQYIFLYKLLYEYWSSKRHSISAAHFNAVSTPYSAAGVFDDEGETYIEEALEEEESGLPPVEPKRIHFQGFTFNE